MDQQTARHTTSLAPSVASNGTGHTLAPLLAKMQRIAYLGEEDRDAIRAWPCRTQAARSGTYLRRDGQIAGECCLVLDGHAFRSKLTGAGHRQIVSFHMSGDIVDLHQLELRVTDHHVQALGDALVAWIPVEAIRATIATRPGVARALWRDSLIEGAIGREWILNVGRRDARTRIAHLLCELIYRRGSAVPGGRDRRFELPMSQEQIADATALTPVHVNRMLQHLEAEKLIERERRTFHINDWAALCSVADFDPAYLHLS